MNTNPTYEELLHENNLLKEQLLSFNGLDILNKFADTFEVNMPILITDPDFKIIYLNNKCESLFKKTKKEILNSYIRDFTLTEALVEHFAIIKKHLSLNNKWEGLIRFDLYPDDIKFLNFNISSIRTGDHISGYIGFINDVTDEINYRNRLLDNEKKLSESELSFRSIFEQAAIGIARVSGQGEYLQVNQKFADILGYEPYEIIHKNYRDFTYSEDLENDEVINYNALTNKINSFRIKKRFIKKNRSIIWVDLYTTILRNLDKSIKYSITIINDITEQIASQEKILASEARFKSLFNNSLTGIFYLHPNGDIIEVNQKIIDMLGSPSVQDTKKINILTYEPLIKIGYSENFKKCLKTKKVVYEETEYFSKWGKMIYARYYFNPIFDSNNNIVGVLANVEDVTERKEFEKKIQENELYLKTLMNNLPGIVYRCLATPDWPMSFVSQGCIELTGYTPEEFVNGEISYDLIIVPEDRKMVWNKIFDAYHKNKPFQLKYRIKDRYGTLKWVWEQGQKIGVNENGINILEGFITDLTRQVEFEEKLKESELKYRTLIENSQDAIFIMDPFGPIKEANTKALEMLGYSASEIIEITFQDVVAPNQQNDTINVLNKLRKGLSVPVYERDFRTNYGTIIPVEISVALIKDYFGDEVIVSVVRDISSRKEAEKQLIRAKEKAEESDKLKSAFLANMSHEIRTPMNGIVGFSQLLKDEEMSDEERQEYISIISSSSNHLLKLIDDIINIAKIEANQLKVNIFKFNLNVTMNEIYDLFKNDTLTVYKNEIEFINETHSDENVYILSDPTRIKQVMTNLIKNALKFTEKGYVKFGYNIKNDKIEFYVKDSGIGIPENKLEMIFDRFTQADTKFSSIYGGTGLGLSISKGLVKLMGGDIWVDSQLGEGSNFYFTLPYNKAESHHDPKKDNDLKHIFVNWENKTVLIAEDNNTNFILLERMLRPTKINIIKAVNGKEVIDIYTDKQQLVDVILMDIKMPVLDGYQATKEIRRFDNSIPVIAVTAYAMHGDEQKSRIAGCNDYLPKPLSRNSLISTLSKYLDK